MKEYKLFAKNIGLFGITQFILNMQGIILLSILTKYLSVSDYGVWSQIKITISLLVSISLLGLEHALIRFISGKQNKKQISKEFFSPLIIVIFVAIIFGIIIYIFSNRIGLILTHVDNSGFFFRLAIPLLILSVIHTFFLSFFRAKEDIKVFSIMEILRIFLELIFIYLLLDLGYGLFGILITFIIIRVITLILGMAFLSKYMSYPQFSFNTVRFYLNYSVPLIISPLLFWILQTSDQYIIGFFNGAKVVGIYSLMYSLSFLLKLLADPIYFLLYPVLSRASNKKEPNSIDIYFNYSYKYIFMFAIPSLFGLNILSEPILKIFSTTQYIEGRIVLPLISTGIVIYHLFILASILLMLAKKTKDITKILIFLSVFNILLNILFVPKFGILGAAITTLLTFLIAGIYGIKIIKEMKFSLQPLFILKCILSSIIMSLFILAIRNMHIGNSLFKLSVIIIFSLPIYFFVLYLINGINKHEIVFFANLIKREK